jgi:hypothetical protein
MNNLTTSFNNMQEVLLSAADSFFSTFAGYVPSIIGALAIFIIGLIISSVLRGTTKKVLDWTGFSRATDKAELNSSLQKVGIKKTLSGMLAALVYWIVFLIFLTAAFETLGLQIVVTTLNDLIAYLPNVIIAAITIVLALLLGRFVKGLVLAGLEQLNISFGGVVASIAEVFVVLFGAAIAASQLGLDVTIITANVTLIIAGVIAVLVLSLGLGSRTAAANLVNGYYTKQIFKKGSTVNLGGYRGKIKEVNNVAVVLEVNGEEIIIPNEEALKHGSIVVK